MKILFTSIGQTKSYLILLVFFVLATALVVHVEVESFRQEVFFGQLETSKVVRGGQYEVPEFTERQQIEEFYRVIYGSSGCQRDRCLDLKRLLTKQEVATGDLLAYAVFERQQDSDLPAMVILVHEYNENVEVLILDVSTPLLVVELERFKLNHFSFEIRDDLFRITPVLPNKAYVGIIKEECLGGAYGDNGCLGVFSSSVLISYDESDNKYTLGVPSRQESAKLLAANGFEDHVSDGFVSHNYHEIFLPGDFSLEVGSSQEVAVIHYAVDGSPNVLYSFIWHVSEQRQATPLQISGSKLHYPESQHVGKSNKFTRQELASPTYQLSPDQLVKQSCTDYPKEELTANWVHSKIDLEYGIFDTWGPEPFTDIRTFNGKVYGLPYVVAVTDERFSYCNELISGFGQSVVSPPQSCIVGEDPGVISILMALDRSGWECW